MIRIIRSGGRAMITQKQYVDRLEKMLKVEKPCATCPARVKFGHWETASVVKGWEGKDKVNPSYEICAMCGDFVGVEDGGNVPCPCMTLKGPDEAISRAHAAIKAYREGKHKWQRKGGKGNDQNHR